MQADSLGAGYRAALDGERDIHLAQLVPHARFRQDFSVALKPRIRWPIINAMNFRETGIAELQAEVDIDPYDPFLRCNLACALGSIGDYQSAFQHLGAAMEYADGAIAAGCVSSAIREITGEFARLWQLPMEAPGQALVSA